MSTLSCDCGFSASGESKYKAEAAMWHHAIHDHTDMLKSMTVEMLEQWLVQKYKQLAKAN